MFFCQVSVLNPVDAIVKLSAQFLKVSVCATVASLFEWYSCIIDQKDFPVMGQPTNISKFLVKQCRSKVNVPGQDRDGNKKSINVKVSSQSF